MGRPLRILQVEDSERDSALLLLYLKRGGFETTLRRVDNEQAMREQLRTGEWDVVVCDFNLPSFDAYRAIAAVKESKKAIPVIVLSGEISREVIEGVTRAGANEYLAKYEMRQIVPAIERLLGSGSKVS
jgi:CheY-like chemotaxis protein